MNQQRKTITTCPYCHKSLQTRTAINNDIQIDPSKIPYSSIGHRRDVGAGIRRCNHCKKYYVFTYENAYNLFGGYPQCFSWYMKSEATLTRDVCQSILKEMKEQNRNIPKTIGELV